jgi:hypothetical protein
MSFCLAGAELKPDFNKLAPVAPCPALVKEAGTRKIPIEGIDSPGEAGTLNPGDSATALFTLFEKGGRKTQWLLLIEAVVPTAEEKARPPRAPAILYVGAGDKLEFAHRMAPATLRLVGPFVESRGETKSARVEDKSERVILDKGFLGIGHDEAAAVIYRIMQNHLHGQLRVRGTPFTEADIAEGRKGITALQLSPKEQRALVGSSMALESYFELVQQTPGLDDVFLKIVNPPSVWSIVRHFGVKVNLDLLRKEVAPAEAPAWNLPPGTPCYDLPLGFWVNDQPALLVTFVVAPPRPPMLSCGGIVGLVAERPEDKETYLSLRIISAHYHASAGEHAQVENQ